MAYTFRNWYQDNKDLLTVSLVDTYNSMTDASMVEPTTVDEMTKLLTWSMAALHRLYPLACLDDNGSTFADKDAFDADSETKMQFQEILEHNIVLIVNNWRQTQFFQNDENGKDVVESKNQPVSLDGVAGNPVNAPTTAANVSYNLFDINLKADKNLGQVSQILKSVKAEFEQFLDIYGGAN